VSLPGVIEQVVIVRDEQDSQVVAREVPDLQVVFGGEQGPQGPQGIRGVPGPAGGSALQYTAGIALGGHRAVVLDGAALAVYADAGTPDHAVRVLGVTTGAVAAGDLATIQVSGELVEPSWAWALNQPIYLGADGLLAQSPPLAGFSLIVGFPLTATSMLVAIAQPIALV